MSIMPACHQNNPGRCDFALSEDKTPKNNTTKITMKT